MVAYEGSEPYVFISYAHKDKNKVLPIVEGLQKRGFRVWYDEGLEVGFEWPEYIAKYLRRSHCVLAFVTGNFDASHNCRREINFAIKKRKDPMVIYMEDEELLSDGMQMQLCPLHAMYLDHYADNEQFLAALSMAALLQPCLGKKAMAAKPAETTAEQRRQAASVERKKEIIHSAISYAANQKYGKGAAALAKPKEPAAEELCQQAAVFDSQKEYAKAYVLYKQAAEQGYTPAQFLLGCYYANGIGAARNHEEAVKWYRRAAERGYALAQYCLGVVYQYGNAAVRMDKEEARKWYQMAADQGNGDAIRKLKML